jgi:hypothetical protein
MRFFGLLLFCLSVPALAKIELKTQIHDVDYGQQMGDEVLVLLKSGHVAKLPTWNKSQIDELQNAKASSQNLSIVLDENRNIISTEYFSTQATKGLNPNLMTNPNGMYVRKSMLQYIPTTIKDMATAKQYFKKAKLPSKEETQCFNRAAVWTYEWWKEHSLKSNKILIFFTRNYIRRYNFEWWFHIAPYVHVMEEGKVVERVMDRKYSGGPLPFRKWTNIFTNKDPECPVITKYSDYADNPYVGECYITRTHMFTYQPADLQMYEAWNYTKEAFNMNEIKWAYEEAFSAPGPEEEEEEEEEGPRFPDPETDTETLTR